ncbi:Ribosomal protein S18 acetylase RimI [Halopelagius inordinatus]|uniref:Ribosomal protein S18 acetylase RimI n=1 Tax=Halopelagius inordinatus TaxID=553467 RepID=A0A1I2RY51_9EURY|nr:GNAT family N-acetyltransferase [Halopelagius inordinatus]SFG45420.1 Ribosomal protein S18 acetylase RimI [Halopelagius inordinatus]
MTDRPAYEYEDEAGEAVLVRPARPEDYDAVAAFTSDTWTDRGVDDYIGDVYHDWIADDDGETRQTFVADVGSDPPTTELGGIVQVTMLSPFEAWAQGMRVSPDFRGRGVAKRLSDATFRFAREAGASVVRNMIFSWNVASLGLTRDTGYDPGIEFRWVHPRPDADADSELSVETGDDADPDAAWSFWTGSDVRTDLRGLVSDPDETWALSELTRERLHDAADEGRLFVVRAGGTRGFAYRNRTYDRESDDGETQTWAEYAVGAWARDDEDAARAVVAAVSRDAASVDADRTRVLVPEGPQWVTDAAVARADVAEQPTFVMEADLT